MNALEHLFDFGKNKIKLMLEGRQHVMLGPGKQWLPDELASHPYLNQTSFKPLESREVQAPTPVPNTGATSADDQGDQGQDTGDQGDGSADQSGTDQIDDTANRKPRRSK